MSERKIQGLFLSAKLKIVNAFECRKSRNEIQRELGRYNRSINRPIHSYKRSCTDICWLILFIILLGVWGCIGLYGMTYGDLLKLIAPIDSKGRRCGLETGLENKKHLVFFNIAKCLSPTAITGCSTPQVCVSQCPTETIFFDKEMKEKNFNELKSSMVCTDDIHVNTSYTDAIEYINKGKCARHVVKSQSVLFRCIAHLPNLQCQDNMSPKSLSPLKNTCVNSATMLDSYLGWTIASWIFPANTAEREIQILSAYITNELVRSRWYLLYAVFVVVFICFMYIVLLRWVAGLIIWASIASVFSLLAFCVYLCSKSYVFYKDIQQTTNKSGKEPSTFSKPGTWLGILLAVVVIMVILLLMVIYLRKQISIAIAFIKEGSKAVTAIKSAVFFPVFLWIIQCAVIVYSVLVLIHLSSIGDSVFKIVNLKNDTCDCNGIYTEDYQDCDPVNFLVNCIDVNGGACKLATCHFIGLNRPRVVQYFQWVNLLGFYWTIYFISGVSDMILARTFSTWYWNDRKRDFPDYPLTSAIFLILRCHMGTVAFGALITAIVQVINCILKFIKKIIQKLDCVCVSFCNRFCFCTEYFLGDINQNAYIMCAIYGHGFRKDARDAFLLLTKNIKRLDMYDKVTDFLFLLSKLLISCGVGCAMYYLLEWKVMYEVTQGQPLHYNYIPAIILSVAAYIISTMFFNVYAMAIDTLFLCFLEDCEINDGSLEKPYFMSKNLMKILGKSLGERSPIKVPDAE